MTDEQTIIRIRDQFGKELADELESLKLRVEQLEQYLSTLDF